MKLQQLRYFQTACRLGSVSRAAEELHVSQPAVSMAIQELEREFGAALLARRYQGLAVTEAGKTLWEMSESLLRHADHVEERMTALGSQRRPVRLGVPPMIGTVLLPALYRALERRYPELLLNTEELGTKTLLHDLRENVLDLAFVSHREALPPEFLAERVAKMEVVWCAARTHRLTGEASVAPELLQEEPLVFFQSGFSSRELVIDWFQAAGVQPRILHATDQLSTVTSLIRSGTATGFLLRPLAEEGLAGIPLDPPLAVQVSLVRRRARKPFRDMARLLELCLEEPLL